MTTKRVSTFHASSFPQRLCSMLGADSHRLRHTPAFFVMALIAFVVPILILVMTAMVGGADPNADAMPMFTNTFQIVASDSASSMKAMSAMGGMMGGGEAAADAGAGAMDMGAMMNMNLMYFMAAVFVCLFVAEDFRSGYAKDGIRLLQNDRRRGRRHGLPAALLPRRPCGWFRRGAFHGSRRGRRLRRDLLPAGKIFLMAVFVAIFVLMSVIGKGRTWMSILLSLFAGMLLFMMIPMMTPLGRCLAGGLVFAAGVGTVSSLVLNKTSLV